MPVAYRLMEGAKNRILVVDQRQAALTPPAADTLRRWGDPTTGPGFDQLMWVGPSADPAHAASYRVFNADGSEVEQCGNGVRCVAMTVGETGDELVFESPAGLITARLLNDGEVAVDMGQPTFAPELIPFTAPAEAETYALEVDGTEYRVAVLSMGNPHCVLTVDAVASAPVAELGTRIQQHSRFPASVNVGFMAIKARDRIDLRVCERGVGETLACGTGACAAVVAGIRAGALAAEVAVTLPGGRLVVSWRGIGTPVWMTGDAELLSEGSIDL